MKKLISLLSVFCLSNVCYGSGYSPEIDFSVERKSHEPKFATFAEQEQFTQQRFEALNIDQILQAPMPNFKKIESINAKSMPEVYELFEGETKITSKKSRSQAGKYLYIPDINFGVGVIAYGKGFVAAGHFI